MSQHEPLRPISASKLETLEEAVAAYQSQLTDSVQEWYLRARGLDDQALAGARLGAVIDPIPGHERYEGMICIPYLLADGTPVSMKFRCSEEHKCKDHGHVKYLGLPHEPARVFSVGSIEKAGDVLHVAEGEFDAIILNSVGLPAIGLPGASNWKPSYRRLLAGFSRIWIWADPDQAGGDMASRLEQALPSARRVRLDGGDVNETFMEKGAEGLLSLVESGKVVPA